MPKGLQVHTTGSSVAGAGQVHKFLNDGSAVFGSGSAAAGIDNKSITMFDATNGAGSVSVYGNLSASVNISASQYYGDGSKLTGINASNVNPTNEGSDTTNFITFTNAATGDQGLKTNTGLSYNANTNTLAATNFTGIASSATALATGSDKTKLDGIEASADVTDTANVTAAGALMDSELSSIADVKALDQSVVSGATPTFTTTNFTDASDKRLMTDAQETKLDSVESSADVTDTANVTAAGALMDSELTSIADVKALDQSVVSGATPTFTTTNFTDASNKRLMTDAQETKLDSVETNADVTDTANVKAALGAAMPSNALALGDSSSTITIPGNLTVSGTTTTLNTATVNIADHNIVLDSDNGTSSVIDGAGITIEGGSGDDVTLSWVLASDRFDLKKGSSYAGLKAGTFTGNLTGDVTGDASGNAGTATKIASITNSDIVQLTATQTLTNKSLTSPTITGTGAIAGTFTGNLTGDVTGNASGTAATVTQAAQTAITSVGTLTALDVDNVNINGNTIAASSGALNLTPAGGSAIVLDGTINIDAGIVTGATSITSNAFVGALTGNASSATVATTVTISDNESTNEENAILFSAGADTDGGNLGVEQDHSGLTYNPSAGKLTATQLSASGDLSSSRLMTGVVSGSTDANLEISSDADMIFVIDADGDGVQNYSFKTGTSSVAEMDEAGSLQLSGGLSASLGVSGSELWLSSVLVTSTAAELNYLDIASLGTAAASKALVADGSANINASAITFTNLGTVTTADINGGTIDGATIATSDVTVGAGKTLNVSAGTLTTSAAQNLAIMQGAGANVDIGAYELRASTLESDVATGTAPLTVASTTLVANLNADKLDGQEGSYYTDFSNMTVDNDEISGDKINGGTIGSTTITALTTAGITATADIDIGAYDLRAATVTADGLTAGQVVYAGTNGVLSAEAGFEYDASSNTLTVANLTVSGDTTTVSTTNMLVEDKLVELANGQSGTPSGDIGMVFERGSSDNAFMGWDESADEFHLATTSATGASTGDLTLASAHLRTKSNRLAGYDKDTTADLNELNAIATTPSNYNGMVFYVSDAPTTGTAFDAGIHTSGKFYFVEGGVIYPSPFTNS